MPDMRSCSRCRGAPWDDQTLLPAVFTWKARCFRQCKWKQRRFVATFCPGNPNSQLAVSKLPQGLRIALQHDTSHGGFCAGGRRTLSSCSVEQMYCSLRSGCMSLSAPVPSPLTPNSMHEPIVSS
jgi:hypothetical protein